MKSTNVRANRHSSRRRLQKRLRTAGLNAARDVFSQLTWMAPTVALPMAERLFVSTWRRRARSVELKALGSAREIALRRGRRKLAGWVWGEQGPLVLLVHGWNGRASQMSAMAMPLVEAGYRVAAFDLTGHGRSSGSWATAVLLAEDVLHIGEVMGPIEAVVTHSFGGAVTSLALLAGLQVKRAVYVAPPLKARHWFELFVRSLRIHPNMVPALQSRLEQRVGLEFDELNGARMAPVMRTPLLVIHDRHDRDVPLSAGQQLAELWPGAELKVTEGLGHNRILRDHDVVQSVVQFITQDRLQAAS